MNTKELIDVIVECAKLVRKQLSYGFEEKVYKNAMYIELKKHQLLVEVEVPIKVYYDGQVVGDFRADMIIDKRIIIELKATNALAIVHSALLQMPISISTILLSLKPRISLISRIYISHV